MKACRVVVGALVIAPDAAHVAPLDALAAS